MRQRLFDQDRPPMPVLVRLTVVLLFWTLLLYALIAARTFLYPLALGVLFALLLLPITSRLERWGVPRIIANLVGLVLGGGIIYGVVFFLYRQIGALLQELPNIKEQATTNLRDLMESVAGRVGIKVTPEVESTLFDSFEGILRGTGDSLGEVLNATGNTVLAIGLMPVYVFMFLYYRDKFARFLMMLVPDSAQELGRTVLVKVSLVTTRYMTGMFAVVLILSVLNSVGFLIIGLQYAILMGVIAAICNIIPYFGTIIGYSIPFAFAFLTGTGFDLAFAVLIQFMIIQFSENNIITPNILGGMLRINPFFIILGVLAGGMVWGLPGMFVIVPMLAMLKVMCDHVPALKPYSFLMSDRGTEKHSITARKVRRMFAFSPVAKKEVEGMMNDLDDKDAAQ
jgi:predicted PurR-regulated permease PerM